MLVEVEAADLETLIFATAVIREIEGSLARRLDDPFVKPHLAHSVALNNCMSALNAAKRANAGTAINYNEPLTRAEIEYLDGLMKLPTPLRRGITGSQRREDEEIDSLACKGCVRIGQDVVGTVWSGEARPDLQTTSYFSVAITERGKRKLEEAKHPQTEMPLGAGGVK